MQTATDGNGNTVRYGYDGFGQMIERTDALGNTDLYEYDAEGNRVGHVDRNGVRTKMTYNMYHDIMSVSAEGKKLASYGYTGDGLLKYGISGGMRYDYSYDSMGRLTGKTAGGRKLVSYTYDEAGNRDSMTDVTGKKTEYVYDPEGKLIKVRENGKVLAEYEYDRAGRKIKTKLGEVLTQTVSYTSDSQIKRMRSLLGTEILVDECYAYDPNGNVVERTGLTGRMKYGYDERNRLTWIEGSDVRGEISEKLTYDHAGNRISREAISRGRTACEILEQYSYDNGNRLLELKRLERNLEYLEGFESTEHFSYDKQGNMLSDGQFVYDYDEQNRLVRATGKTGSEAENRSQINRYDAEGLRAEMEENGRLVRYIYSDREVMTEEDEEGEIIRYVRGLGIVASDTEKARTYYHYKESAASDSDENESRRKGENVSDDPRYHYYELDAQDSTRLIVDEKGIENSYEYDAFGKIIEATEHVRNRFTYTGQQYDAVTQQYYLRARFYNPVIARFLQEDTYLGDGLNLYAYCQNNPLKYYDPTGHDCGKKTNSFNSSETSKTTDFYVTPSGDVVPATGYRYMDSGRANDALIQGEQYTTYIGFTKYDSASQVKDAFQVADVWSDCKVRGEFDTLQVIDKMYVPTEKGNTTTILEPITCSYPEYGKGGEYQLCVDAVVKFTNVTIIGD